MIQVRRRCSFQGKVWRHCPCWHPELRRWPWWEIAHPPSPWWMATRSSKPRRLRRQKMLKYEKPYCNIFTGRALLLDDREIQSVFRPVKGSKNYRACESHDIFTCLTRKLKISMYAKATNNLRGFIINVTQDHRACSEWVKISWPNEGPSKFFSLSNLNQILPIVPVKIFPSNWICLIYSTRHRSIFFINI